MTRAIAAARAAGTPPGRDRRAGISRGFPGLCQGPRVLVTGPGDGDHARIAQTFRALGAEMPRRGSFSALSRLSRPCPGGTGRVRGGVLRGGGRRGLLVWGGWPRRVAVFVAEGL